MHYSFYICKPKFQFVIMEDNEKSPIIERLCKFIDASGLSNSQFADKAGIPRPSLSQMLHGRNKSLNNQVLSKLNDAFPQLNIVWLLFGQGTMLQNANIEFSEPQNASIFDAPTFENVEKQTPTSRPDGPKTVPPTNRNSEPAVEIAEMASKNASMADGTTPPPSAAAYFAGAAGAAARTKDPTKKISSIIVFFNDGSFENFLPSSYD